MLPGHLCYPGHPILPGQLLSKLPSPFHILFHEQEKKRKKKKNEIITDQGLAKSVGGGGSENGNVMVTVTANWQAIVAKVYYNL